MSAHRSHAIVEVIDHTGKAAERVGTAKNAVRVAKAISGSEAFRKYNWLRGVPVGNVSGNFRGMVVSPRWRAIFDFSEKYLQKTEKVNVVAEKIVIVASMAQNLLKTAPEIEQILDSRAPWATKAAKLGPQLTSVMSRTLYELVSGPARWLATSMIAQGYCDIGDVIRGEAIGSCQKKLKLSINRIDSAVSQYTDGNTLYLLIDTRINPVVSNILGF